MVTPCPTDSQEKKKILLLERPVEPPWEPPAAINSRVPGSLAASANPCPSIEHPTFEFQRRVASDTATVFPCSVVFRRPLDTKLVVRQRLGRDKTGAVHFFNRFSYPAASILAASD